MPRWVQKLRQNLHQKPRAALELSDPSGDLWFSEPQDVTVEKVFEDWFRNHRLLLEKYEQREFRQSAGKGR